MARKRARAPGVSLARKLAFSILHAARCAPNRHAHPERCHAINVVIQVGGASIRADPETPPETRDTVLAYNHFLAALTPIARCRSYHSFDEEVLQLQVTGEMLIGRSAVRGSAGTQRALNPALKEEMEPAFGLATQDLIAQACELANAAFDSYRLST